MALEQLICAPKPPQGQLGFEEPRAESPAFPKAEIRQASGNYPVPFRQELFQGDYRAVEVIRTGRHVFLSIARERAKLDDHGRSGVAAHIIAIPSATINSIPFSAIENQVIDYQESIGIPIGKVEPIEVEWDDGTDSYELNHMKAWVTEEKAAKIGSTMVDDEAKILLNMERSTWRGRIDMTYAVSKFLFKCGIEDFFFLSDNRINAGPEFHMKRLVAVSPYNPHLSGNSKWIMIDLSGAQTSSSPGSATTVEEAIRGLYGRGG